MRKIKFGTYDSWKSWGLTLTSFNLSAPEHKTAYVSVPGRDGDLDLSTALTDGEPRYNSRQLTATFELSTGSRGERLAVFDRIVNALDGRRMDIVLPDDESHYLTGRLQVAIDYCDMAHGALTVNAVCDPWKLAVRERVQTLTAAATAGTVVLGNDGRRILIPAVVVSGSDASVTLVSGEKTWTLTEGSYSLPDLQLKPGNTPLTYSGRGTVILTWREAVL